MKGIKPLKAYSRIQYPLQAGLFKQLFLLVNVQFNVILPV